MLGCRNKYGLRNIKNMIIHYVLHDAKFKSEQEVHDNYFRLYTSWVNSCVSYPVFRALPETVLTSCKKPGKQDCSYPNHMTCHLVGTQQNDHLFGAIFSQLSGFCTQLQLSKVSLRTLVCLDASGCCKSAAGSVCHFARA